MTLLPRRLRPGILLAILAIILALPVTWTDQAPWQGPTPALSRAGGSPDETLPPQPTPPQSSTSGGSKRAPSVREEGGRIERSTTVATRHDPGQVNWLLVWKITLASVLRF